MTFPYDLSISLGRRIDVDSDELVALVAHAFYAERPYLEILFLPLDQRGCVGREASLVGYGALANGSDASGMIEASKIALSE
jgi:hypothetical protein